METVRWWLVSFDFVASSGCGDEIGRRLRPRLLPDESRRTRVRATWCLTRRSLDCWSRAVESMAVLEIPCFVDYQWARWRETMKTTNWLSNLICVVVLIRCLDLNYNMLN